MFVHRRALLVVLALFSCAGCSGTASPFIGISATPTPVASSTPGASPTPGAIVLAPSTLSFTATGAASAQNVGVSEANYSGSFTASTTNCSGIATIATAAGSSFTVTPAGAGHCTFSIAGSPGTAATLTIDVTTTTVGGS